MAATAPADAHIPFECEPGEQRTSPSRNRKPCAIFSAFMLGMVVATIGLGTVQHYGLGDVSITAFFLSPAASRVQHASGAIAASGSYHGVPSVQMMAKELEAKGVDRRQFLQTAGAAAALASPLAAVADGAVSRTTVLRARTIYGSRVFKLKNAEAEAIAAEENAFTLYISGGWRTLDLKETANKLKAIQKEAISAAKAGDKAGANAAVKKFCDVAGLKEDPMKPGGQFDPRQRRNPGAPTTADLEGMMSSESYSLYQPLKPGAPAAKNR